MLHDLHTQYGVCGQFMVPSTAFALHVGDTLVDRVLKAMGTLGVGLLMPSSVYSCLHAHLPQVQWPVRWSATRSYTFKARHVCVLCGPRTDAVLRFLTDPANDLVKAMSPDTGQYSFRNVTNTICTFRLRESGPLSWAMCG